MITAFRKKLGTVLLWGIIVVVTAGLLMYLVPSYLGSGAGAGRGGVGGSFVVATVGADKITYDEFSRGYANLLAMYRRQFGAQFDERQLAGFLREQVIEQLVVQRILLQRARALGITVTPEEVGAEIKANPVFGQGGFSKATYLALLRQNGLTPETYEAGIQQELTLRKLEDLVKGSVKISDHELRDGYNARKQQLTVEYVEFPDTAKAKEPADKITLALGEGKDFKAAAQAAGVELKTVSFGGPSGAGPQGLKDPEAFGQAVRSRKVGTVSSLIQGTSAAYLLRVVDKKLPGDADFEKEKVTFRREALQLKRRTVFEDWVKEARRATNIYIDRQAIGG
jgi:peptidyl-prolyl cis-trans isomerase D